MPLYPYQQRVKELLHKGKSVILQAPTGAGKTRAAVDPFIEAFFDYKPDFFPRKCIYSVPMRVLANQFTAEYKKLSSKYRRVFNREITTAIQTGDRPEDPKFESNLIFATIDQTLSSFLNIPYSLGKGSGNLNAGAVLSSYLVFDELHLFDPDTTLPTTLEMLRMLKGIAPFIVMTATFSSSMLQRLGNILDAVVVPEDEPRRADMERIGSQIGKNRRFRAVDASLSAAQVLAQKDRPPRVICICNTVQRAQVLYDEITKTLQAQGDSETQVVLLHSRFYKDDRDEKENWIKARFGKRQDEYDGPPLILIATQVVEVGVDATCDVMHTELAPAASILQRAGRCARRENETGLIYVYLPRDDETGEPDYTPYFIKSKARKTDRGRRLCEDTWEALSDSSFTGRHMSFTLEQALIDRVHKPVDEEILDGLQDTRTLHQDDMFRVMRELDPAGSDLIRKVDSRFIIIHPNPETDENLVHNPWHYDGFSFAPGTLVKAFKDFVGRVDGEETPWLMKFAKRLPTEESWLDDEEFPARQPVTWVWNTIWEPGEIYTSPVLAIHPAIAQYSFERGIAFELSDGGYDLRQRDRKKKRESYSYTSETYAEHVAGLYKAYRTSIQDQSAGVTRPPLLDEIAFAVQRLERQLNLSPGSLDRVLRAIFACHDLGKLNVEWQKWAHEWQKRVGKSIPYGYMAAHTDFDGSKAQKEEQRRLGKRPRHAGESAIAAAELLEQLCENSESLWRAALTAITRHHSAKGESYQPWQAHEIAERAFEEALSEVDLPVELAEKVWWQPDESVSLVNYLTRLTPVHSQETLLTFLLSRVLRLADQRSQL